MKTKKQTERSFISEIKRRFPFSEIETTTDAIDQVKNTEYEYIFEYEIDILTAKK